MDKENWLLVMSLICLWIYVLIQSEQYKRVEQRISILETINAVEHSIKTDL